MSVISTLKNFDSLPAGFAVPVSKGKSLGSATADMVTILNTLADEDAWKQYRKNPKAQANLRALGSGLIDAVERNGYDPGKVISAAKGAVLGRLYKEFFAALDNNDLRGMDRVARRILRVGGTVQGLQASIKARAGQYGREVSEEEKALIEGAFQE